VPTADDRAWVENWRETGRVLDEERRRELRELTADRALFLADALLSMPWPEEVLARRRGHSGLLEMRALLQRLSR
jgi:hypothetical protein